LSRRRSVFALKLLIGCMPLEHREPSFRLGLCVPQRFKTALSVRLIDVARPRYLLRLHFSEKILSQQLVLPDYFPDVVDGLVRPSFILLKQHKFLFARQELPNRAVYPVRLRLRKLLCVEDPIEPEISVVGVQGVDCAWGFLARHFDLP
jgi:hypothetical protein